MRNRYFFTSMTRISDLASVPFEVEPIPRDRWGSGDYVAVEVLTTSSGQRIELTSGRQIEVAEGDLVVGAFGHRYATQEATGTWRKIGDDGRLSFLTGAGLLGRCTSRSTVAPLLTTARYLGHVVRDGTPTRMADFVAVPPAATFDLPVVLVIGTSMSAGKTTAARLVIRLLKREGLRVAGSKLTGAGRYADVLSMSDAGADAIVDFVDGGLPSTVCPEEDYRQALEGLLARLAHAGPDVAVVEVGASPLEPYNGDVAIDRIREHVRFTILCASDPYSVVGVMTAYGARPSLVTGIATNTLAGVELVEELTGVPALNIRDKAARPELRDRVMARLDV